MKRHIIRLSILLFCTLAAASCEDFLDKVPDEDLTIEEVFSNRLYARDFLTHTYSWIPTEANFADDGGAWRSPFVGGCDEMEIAYGAAYSHQINAGAWSPADISRSQIWPESFMAIRKCNMFIENVDKVPTAEAEKQQWKAEAYFLRAYFHFLVLRTYGPIPLLDHALATDEDMMAIRRSPYDKCVDFIVEDLDLAAKTLPAAQTNTELGRATKLSCLGLKSRVLLYAASPLFNGNTAYANFLDVDGTPMINQVYDAEKWKRAADAAIECLEAAEAGGYGLYYSSDNDPVKSYAEIFYKNWNKEILWAKNIAYYDHYLNCADPVSFGCYSILNPTQEQVDAYQMADGTTPITGYTNNGLTPIINPASGYTETGFTDTAHPKGYHPEGISNMYVGREPRFYASINFAGQVWKTTRASNWTVPHKLEFWYHGIDGKGVAGSDYCKTGYLMRKIVTPERIPWQYTPLLTWTYIRLGEIYLNAAEAINEYYGPADAYEYIRAIRTRAGFDPDNDKGLPAGMTKEEMRDVIKHERRIELAFETHRFFDVRRWKDAEVSECKPIHSLNIYAGTHLQDPAFYERIEVEKRVFESPKHYLFPVDQTEIDKNQRRLLIQNPGWTGTETAETPAE